MVPDAGDKFCKTIAMNIIKKTGTKRHRYLNACCLCLGFALVLASMPLSPLLAQSAQTPPRAKAKMAWWENARFGMFIHWGLYSEAAGYWEGKPVEGIGEWIMNNGHIPRDQYAQLAKTFNPVDFNAAKWVKIAKDAGMKYIVITTKHHDGFCMFGTKATPYNVV